MQVFCKSLFLASRPKTLVAALCPILLGAALAFYLSGPFYWFDFWVLVVASVCIQVATNFFNDALDSDMGRDSKNRLGPVRAAATGALSSRFLKLAACSLLVLALICGVILFFKTGPWIFLVGLPALALAYLYTGTRFALSTTGVADIFVILYFGLFPVWVTTRVLSGEFSTDAALMGLALGLFSNALLLINNLRDVEEDQNGNKKTLVVRFGRKFGLSFLFLCLLGPYPLLRFTDEIYFRAAWWSTLILPLSCLLYTSPSPRDQRGSRMPSSA